MDNKFIKDAETGSFDRVCRELEVMLDLVPDKKWDLQIKKEDKINKIRSTRKYEPKKYVLEIHTDAYEKNENDSITIRLSKTDLENLIQFSTNVLNRNDKYAFTMVSNKKKYLGISEIKK